jgi:predicted HTH transcriptional regulator
MQNLLERIKKGESRTLEFKREVPDSLHNILKNIVSFANDASSEVGSQRSEVGE